MMQWINLSVRDWVHLLVPAPSQMFFLRPGKTSLTRTHCPRQIANLCLGWGAITGYEIWLLYLQMWSTLIEATCVSKALISHTHTDTHVTTNNN